MTFIIPLTILPRLGAPEMVARECRGTLITTLQKEGFNAARRRTTELMSLLFDERSDLQIKLGSAVFESYAHSVYGR
jgi:hypothetical protein